MKENILDKTAYLQEPLSAAQFFLGRTLTVDDTSIIITETECYFGPEDLASHARFGKTKRSEILFHEGGILYIYLIYGIHLCLNIVVDKKEVGGAVLIRGGLTSQGEQIIGPGRVGKYLKLSKSMNGRALFENNGAFIEKERVLDCSMVASGPRIGVAYAGQWAEKPFRFWIPIVSKA